MTKAWSRLKERWEDGISNIWIKKNYILNYDLFATLPNTWVLELVALKIYFQWSYAHVGRFKTPVVNLFSLSAKWKLTKTKLSLRTNFNEDLDSKVITKFPEIRGDLLKSGFECSQIQFLEFSEVVKVLIKESSSLMAHWNIEKSIGWFLKSATNHKLSSQIALDRTANLFANTKANFDFHPSSPPLENFWLSGDCGEH